MVRAGLIEAPAAYNRLMPACAPAAARHDVVVMVYRRLSLFEFSILGEVFGRDRPELDLPWYTFQPVAIEEGPLQTDVGLRIEASEDWERIAAADTLVVPGWRSPEEPPPARALEALRAAHERGARIVSICSGVFVLAAAGLLDGRRATTHWRYAEELRRRYPAVRLNEDVLYVTDGQLFTSAGSAAGIDLCLHLVREDHGAAIANHVAQRLVMPAHRDGGQRQFIPAPVEPEDADRLAPLLGWIDENLHEPQSIEALAERAHLSVRHLNRRFKERTGLSPLRYLHLRRIDRARQLLEQSDWAMDRVAHAVGFSSAQHLRLHFRRVVGTTPLAYRRSFANAPQESEP